MEVVVNIETVYVKRFFAYRRTVVNRENDHENEPRSKGESNVSIFKGSLSDISF